MYILRLLLAKATVANTASLLRKNKHFIARLYISGLRIPNETKQHMVFFVKNTVTGQVSTIYLSIYLSIYLHLHPQTGQGIHRLLIT